MKYFVSDDSSLGHPLVAKSPEGAADLAREQGWVGRDVALKVRWNVEFMADGTRWWFARTLDLPGPASTPVKHKKEPVPA